MKLNQWIDEFRKAYLLAGDTLTKQKETVLLSTVTGIEPSNSGDILFKIDRGEISTTDANCIINEAEIVLFKYLFAKAANGDVFGDSHRIEETFGASVEVRYGSMDGTFIRLARTYWSFRIEVDDVAPDLLQSGLVGIKVILLLLRRTDNQLASAFFPTPGPHVNVKERIDLQKELLGKYSQAISHDVLMAEDPILRANLNRNKGCLGALLVGLPILVSKL